jgi:cytochrome b6-f complex iron-sulfur subunit
MSLFIVLVIVVAIAALLFIGLTFRNRDSERATGYVSRETAKRDKKHDALDTIAETEGVRSGRDVERSVALARSGGLEPVPPAPVAIREPLDEEALGVTRRQFLNRSVTGLFAFSLASFGAACIAFLWPTLKGGFGSKIRVGTVADLQATMSTTKEPVYKPEGRLYLNPYPKSGVAKAKGVPAYSAVIPGYDAGFVALYQKCVHLGCRVPWCKSSQWFECPCHGSQYSRVGEKKAGPAPRGLDRFVVTVEGDTVVVDTKQIIPGPPLGTDTTGQQLEGPHCA